MTHAIKLPAEGERKLFERVRQRHECESCGSPATKRHTYLLDNARHDPASTAYGRDDCSWCSDHESFTCDACDAPPAPHGYGWCSTFTASPEKPRFAHMLLYWNDREICAESTLAAAQQALWQYISDLRFPPEGDSVERRLEMARKASSGLDALVAERTGA